jgi:hypothetical protein
VPCGPADHKCAGVSSGRKRRGGAEHHPRYGNASTPLHLNWNCASFPLSIRFNAMVVASRSVCVAQVCDRDGCVMSSVCDGGGSGLTELPIVPLKPSHRRRLPPSATCLSCCCSPTLSSSHELAERRHCRVTNARCRQPALHQLRVRCRRIHQPSAAVVERPTQQAQGPRPRKLPRSPHAASGAPRQQRSPEGSP